MHLIGHRRIARPDKLRLQWHHTWPEGGPDFTWSPAAPDGANFVRIYRAEANAAREGRNWFWVTSALVSGRGVKRSGYEGSKHAAAAMAERVWFDLQSQNHAMDESPSDSTIDGNMEPSDGSTEER